MLVNQTIIYMQIQQGQVTPHLVQVIVKICIPGTEVASEQRGVSGENGGQREAAGAAQDQSSTSLPLVEVGDHVGPVAQLICQLEEPQQCDLGGSLLINAGQCDLC